MKHEITEIVKHYLICALWSSLDDDGEPLDANYDLSGITPELYLKSTKDVEQFVELAGDMLDDWSDEQIGHDFWLTRNGHGTGFWDRDLPFKDELTNLVGYGTKFTPIDIFVNDFNQIDC